MEAETNILDIANTEEAKFLRKGVKPFDFSKFQKKEIDALVKKMRGVLDKTGGVGLAANQIGLDVSVFVAKLDNKFYAIFNPEIVRDSDEMTPMDEGCLSIPGQYGLAYRSDKITLKGYDKNGKAFKMKAWGLLAKIFQHETDHLNGKLFIDRLKPQ